MAEFFNKAAIGLALCIGLVVGVFIGENLGSQKQEGEIVACKQMAPLLAETVNMLPKLMGAPLTSIDCIIQDGKAGLHILIPNEPEKFLPFE